MWQAMKTQRVTVLRADLATRRHKLRAGASLSSIGVHNEELCSAVQAQEINRLCRRQMSSFTAQQAFVNLQFTSSYKSNLYNFGAIDTVQVFNKIWLLI